MFNFAKRIRKLRQQLKQSGIPALLLTNRDNIFYLTGFTGSAGDLLVTATETILLTDARYETQLAEQCPDLNCEIRDTTETMLQRTDKVVRTMKLTSLGFESASLTKGAYDLIESALPQVELVGTADAVESLRAIKDNQEIAAIEKSIAVNERTFEVIRAQLSGDQTEQQVGFNLEHQMRQFGASGCSFEPIVAVGARAALPHARPGQALISDSPFVLIDWGAQVDHYASDLTRVLVTGSPKSVPAKLRKIYNIVLEAQLAGIAAIRPGAVLGDVDQAARKVIEDAGFGKQFGHSLGHGMGLEVHESPSLRSGQKGQLEAGMVVTVEPGIYVPGWGGVRIEDDVLVTSDGHRVLSGLPKQLDACIVDA